MAAAEKAAAEAAHLAEQRKRESEVHAAQRLKHRVDAERARAKNPNALTVNLKVPGLLPLDEHTPATCARAH